MQPALRNDPTQGKNPNGLIGVLDVGTSKICCLIAEYSAGAEPRIRGIGHHVSQGLRGGGVVDMEAAEAAIRATVEAAEQMAGENIREVVVNVSCGHPASRLIAYEVSIAGHEIGDTDLRRVLNPAQADRDIAPERELLHGIPVGYRIDGSRGVRDPRGMYGERLGVNMHLITADSGALRNLATCIKRCHLDISGRIVSPYASALSCLVEDERQLGVVLIDMGGGTTSIAVYFDGEMIHTDVVPIGGVHVTNDIARGLSTPLAHAERMKTLYGSVMPSPSDDREIIKVPVVGEEDESEGSQVPRSMLVGIIRPRVEETFEMVRTRLADAGFDKVSGRRLVLTGGASQLPGAVELAGQILDKQGRLGRPRPMDGLAEATAGPSFATAVGLVNHCANGAAEDTGRAYRPMEEPRGRIDRLGQWFRENF